MRPRESICRAQVASVRFGNGTKSRFPELALANRDNQHVGSRNLTSVFCLVLVCVTGIIKCIEYLLERWFMKSDTKSANLELNLEPWRCGRGRTKLARAGSIFPIGNLRFESPFGDGVCVRNNLC